MSPRGITGRRWRSIVVEDRADPWASLDFEHLMRVKLDPPAVRARSPVVRVTATSSSPPPVLTFVTTVGGRHETRPTGITEGDRRFNGHRQLEADYDRHGPILDRPLA